MSKQDEKELEGRILEVASFLEDSDRKMMIKALEFAKKMHKNQVRKSGKPYIIHPIVVALNLWYRYRDLNLTIAALLHDTVEDSDKFDESIIYEKFGKEIGFIVDALNKRIPGFYKRSRKFQDRIERFLWAGLQNPRIFLLKIADREHNLSDVENLPLNKQVRISFETQAIYEPLGRLLDYQNLKNVDIDGMRDNLLKYIREHDLDKVVDFKKYLVREYYKDFTAETFNEVYKNSDKIIWQTDDMEEFKRLCENKQFDDSVKIVSIHGEGDKKSILFSFQLAHANDKKPKKLRMQSFGS